MDKTDYSVKIGLQKTIKNILVTWVAPAILVLLNNYQQWIPDQYVVSVGVFVSAGSYMIKNWIENK